MSNSNITYTFPANCAVVQLRGKTFTGGELCRTDGKWQAEPDAVKFSERGDGRDVIAGIFGRPELEILLAEHNARIAAKKLILDAIGWTQYNAARRAAGNARGAYDVASERGYPHRESAAMTAAEAALDLARIEYPLAAAYAIADDYSTADNYVKAACGRRAVDQIEAGSDPIQVIENMKLEWAGESERLVQNA